MLKPALSTSNDDSANLKSILANTSLFKMLNEQQLDDILSDTRSVHAKAHTVIVSHGEAAHGAFWVVYGQVKIVLHTRQGT
ncbi:MAG: hypothetical protein ABI575_10505, partial [Oxalobacteraceae bacterium]